MDRLGLIIKSISGEYVVEVDGAEYTCKPIGLFRYKKITPRVGDKCIIDYVDGAWVIKDIKKRKNELVRPVVANIDKVIIVTSLTEPDLNLNLLDRLICQVEYSDIPIVLVFSKADLVNIDDYKKIIEY
ncbi:MAG: GTPase RsgA, partial [Bacilli bacterium]|nr:GTPase RsgA [Bacilli bacterium]